MSDRTERPEPGATTARPADNAGGADPASAPTDRTDAHPAGAGAAGAEEEASVTLRGLAVYLVVGTVFGFVLTKAEAISWFRIQEMFRFQSFHLYGIFATAIVVAGTSLALIRRFELRTRDRDRVEVPPKTMGRGYRYVLGGLCFGSGWALTGACPGPLFALAGSGVGVILFTIACAVVGTWTYGLLRDRLPHY